MDAFISWTSADKDVKNAIVDKLQEGGITCWDSDEYCTSDFSAECIAAIKRCGVFIVIMSDASMQSKYVKNEVIAARDLEHAGKLNILVYKVTDGPYTDEFDFLLNHISFVTGNMIQRKSSVSGESGIDTIVRRAQTLLHRRREGNPEKPFAVHVPEITGLKITRTGYFVAGSRDNILNAMEEGFRRSNVLIMTEFFGFGKRSTIRKYVESRRSDLTAAVMVQNECAGLREFLMAGLSFENINEKTFDNLQGDDLLREKIKLLAKLDERTLLVIPDVKFGNTTDTQLCELLSGLKCRIILLTQDTAEGYADWFPVIPVGRMEDDHLYELFFHHYVRALDEEKEELKEPLARFFAGIGGHTKTVELTAATLNREFGVAPEDLPGYLSMQGTEGMQLKDRIIRQIESIFDIETLTPDEITTLLAAAYLAVPYISEKHFRTLLKSCGVADLHVVEDLDRRRWLDLDIQNRIVSMEPLVAQIVLSKFRDNYEIPSRCLNYLVERSGQIFSITLSGPSHIHFFTRLEYFLAANGLAECAQLANQLYRSVVEDSGYDSGLMTRAITEFEAKYPKKQLTAEPDWDVFDEEFGPDETEIPEETELPEEEEPVHTRESFEAEAVDFVRQLVPMAKFISRDARGLFLDFSAGGNRILQSGDLGTIRTSVLEDAFGMTREESIEILELLREQSQEEEILDDDSLEAHIYLECVSLMDSIYSRDFGNIMAGIHSLLDQISRSPEILMNPEYSDVIFAVFQLMGRVYVSSGAYSSAIVLCEKLLAYPTLPLKKQMILQIYIVALRSSKLYTETLYNAYKDMLGTYDKAAQDVFEIRSDLHREKKLMLLLYAEDLARGGNPEEACARFMDGWKLVPDAHTDQAAACARCIVDILIKSGEFDRAVEFIDTCFPPEKMVELSETGNEETRKAMNDFAAYRHAGKTVGNDFEDNADPRKYVSYYQSFSRKNNRLLEQKYLSVAEQAMEFDFSDLTVEEITAHAAQLRRKAKKEKLLRLAPEAFALASEAGFRVLGYRHHYVQYMGAAAMADGKIAEILNGEGKTYTIVLTAFLQSLYGKQIFVVDQSPDLTVRNHNWMRGVYDLLGVPSRCAADYHEVTTFGTGVTYISLKNLMIGYLRFEQNLETRRSEMPMDCAIVDEIDTTLVDGADSQYSLVTSQTDYQMVRLCRQAWEVAQDVVNEEEYYTYADGKVILQPAIYPLLEQKFRVPYTDLSRMEETHQIEQLVSTAILCCGYYERDRDYFIHNGVPVKENQEKGVFEPVSATYAYFLCAENELDTRQAENNLSSKFRTYNTIGVRDFFRKFKSVCGTTATAVSFREEFREIYGLDYVAIPPHSPCIRKGDEDDPSPLYTTMRSKDRAILEMVKEKAERGQPILIVTQSVKESEKYSRLLNRNRIAHKLLNAKNAHDYADMITWAGVSGSVLVTNALAGRGADIKLGGSPELRTRRELVEMGEDVTALDSFVYSLPTPEQKESSLYKKYYSILEKNRVLCAADRQKVVDAGGLCVIGTGFFPEPRTEQQTRGRSGRQGEVGESWVFRSIEDEGLKSLFTPAMMEWLYSLCDGVEELEAPALYKALKNAQQNIHRARFSGIRKQNDRLRHLEKARADFIGRRFDLTEGVVTVEDVLREWASDKAVLKDLQALQKGESCTDPVLKRLWDNHVQLKTARGMRASAALYSAATAQLDQVFQGYDYASSEEVANALSKSYLRAWEEYIDLVQNTAGKVDMKEQALERYLEEEKKRLLRKASETLLRMRPRKAGAKIS